MNSNRKSDQVECRCSQEFWFMAVLLFVICLLLTLAVTALCIIVIQMDPQVIDRIWNAVLEMFRDPEPLRVRTVVGLDGANETESSVADSEETLVNETSSEEDSDSIETENSDSEDDYRLPRL